MTFREQLVCALASNPNVVSANITHTRLSNLVAIADALVLLVGQSEVRDSASNPGDVRYAVGLTNGSGMVRGPFETVAECLQESPPDDEALSIFSIAPGQAGVELFRWVGGHWINHYE